MSSPSAPSPGVAQPSATRPAPQARGVASRTALETTSPAGQRATPADLEPLVLGRGTRFEGILTFDGFARVAGEIRGGGRRHGGHCRSAGLLGRSVTATHTEHSYEEGCECP